MNPKTDGPAWKRIPSIDEIAKEYSRKLAEARADAHRMIDQRFDRTAAEQAPLLEQLRREFEGEAQH